VYAMKNRPDLIHCLPH